MTPTTKVTAIKQGRISLPWCKTKQRSYNCEVMEVLWISAASALFLTIIYAETLILYKDA